MQAVSTCLPRSDLLHCIRAQLFGADCRQHHNNKRKQQQQRTKKDHRSCTSRRLENWSLNFQVQKTLRRSSEAVVVLTDKERPQVCALRGVTKYTSITHSSGAGVASPHGTHVPGSFARWETWGRGSVHAAHGRSAAGASSLGEAAQPFYVCSDCGQATPGANISIKHQ